VLKILVLKNYDPNINFGHRNTLVKSHTFDDHYNTQTAAGLSVGQYWSDCAALNGSPIVRVSTPNKRG